jgi:glycosyltransferase involved in cell wall biosynthesis
MTNPFRLQHSGLKDRIEVMLERWVVKTADIVVANTDYLREEFVERFGGDMERKCITVLNGFDPEEFAQVEPEVRDDSRQNSFLMVHPGFLYGKRDPRILVDALAILRDQAVIKPGEFICELIGPVELPYDLDSLILSLKLEQFLKLRGPVSYRESLSALASCDVALLLQPGTSTQIPSKLFEYVGFGKTMIAVAPLDSSVARIINANKLGVVASSEDTGAVADAIGAVFSEWRANGHSARIPEDIQLEFDVRRSVRKLGAAMSELVDSPS